MRELIAAAAGLGLLFYIMRNEKAPTIQRTVEAFEPEIIQNTLNLIQEREPNIYPIDTVYFQKNNGNSNYIGRFMFLNTDGFYGVQYDVETDGNVIVSLSKSVPPEYQSPFSAYQAVEKYSKILDVPVPKVDMDKIHKNFKTENMFGFYQRRA